MVSMLETLEQTVTENTICYIVGPIPFMKHMAKLLSGIGLGVSNIRFELLGPAQDILEDANQI